MCLQLAALVSPFFSPTINLQNLCERIQHAMYPPIESEIYSDEVQQIHSALFLLKILTLFSHFQLHNLAYCCLNINPDDRPTSTDALHFATEMHTRTLPVDDDPAI
jgi:serine/threonine protein kinase